MQENIRFLPPRPGVCSMCAVKHAPHQPHYKDSLYYQIRFRHAHGRAPTWRDAMAHCAPDVQRIWVGVLAREGIGVEELDRDV